MRIVHRALGALIVIALTLALAPVANAAPKPPRSSSSSSLRLVLLDSPDERANWGERFTFEVSTTATNQPMVYLKCYQGGGLVFSFSAGYYETYPWTKTAALSSQTWTGGDADCSAELAYYSNSRKRSLATLAFHAYA